VERLFSARFRLGMFDPPERVPYAQIPYSANDSPKHRELALQAARESIVLLKNEGLLPLKDSLRRIAVIGPNADQPLALLGNYNGTPSQPVTPLAGIRQRVEGRAEVLYAPGCDLLSDSTGGFAEAVELASRWRPGDHRSGASPGDRRRRGQTESVPQGRHPGDRESLTCPASRRRCSRPSTPPGRR
jgi:beta-glucosidase